jgi:BolA protein
MRLQNTIEAKLKDALDPLHLEVITESHMHSVPRGSETHFKVIVVSERFEGQPLIQRHRLVTTLLKEELAGGVHALTMQTLTPAQWEAQGRQATLQSPLCRGGSKAG